MLPITFEGSNKTLTAPLDCTREECWNLPVYAEPAPRHGDFIWSCWVPSDSELRDIMSGSPIWLNVWTAAGTHPPVKLTTVSPFE